MPSTAIETELLKALGDKFAAKDGEKPAKYRARLIKAINGLEDAAWDKLSTEAQEWVNAGVDALKAKKDVADFPGAAEDAPAKKETKKDAPKKEAPKADAEDEDGKEEAEEAPAKKEPKKETKKDAPAEPKAKRGGGGETYRTLLIKNPDWDKKKLLEATAAAGFTLSAATAEVMFYETKNTLKVLESLGMLKK